MYIVTLRPPEDAMEGIAGLLGLPREQAGRGIPLGLQRGERLKIASWAVEELL